MIYTENMNKVMAFVRRGDLQHAEAHILYDHFVEMFFNWMRKGQRDGDSFNDSMLHATFSAINVTIEKDHTCVPARQPAAGEPGAVAGNLQ